MSIIQNDRNEWYGMETTKQFLKDLEEKRQELLILIYKKTLNHNTNDATVFSGSLSELEDIINTIHSKKGSADG